MNLDLSLNIKSSWNKYYSSLITVPSLAKALGITDESVYTILDKSPLTGYIPTLVDENDVDFVISTLAKELKKRHNKLRNNWSYISQEKREETEDFNSLLIKLNTEYRITKLNRTSLTSPSFQLKGNNNTQINALDFFFNCQTINSEPQNAFIDIDTTFIEEYLTSMVYPLLKSDFQIIKPDIKIIEEKDKPLMQFFLSKVSINKTKPKKYKTVTVSFISQFYIINHYYIYNNDDEEHSTKEFLRDAS